MSPASDLEAHYRAYISTLNKGDFDLLKEKYLASHILHTGRQLDPDGYCKLVWPHTTFEVDDLMTDVQDRKVASRLSITAGQRHLREIIFYEFDEQWRIYKAWSMVEELVNGIWGPVQ
ncbi:hypothetical protein BD324DRAFT_651917 [Kockovaella imperatae]|uniref:SnoaL-like domain-containing protein n=1 Tax=Kockovaella imperatae TaxID=4999 RepID=A0A1Y1UD99_9TREE|nr:hypothetical protein BD324DRAFT_651917 [Kockovaella imperatae]ORX36011.1 hypothetical protein BD324DRAFT_651917 [Kockovaella imperatae]